MKKMMIQQKKKTMSIDLNMITLLEMQVLLRENAGYIDGDSHTLELFVLKRS